MSTDNTQQTKKQKITTNIPPTNQQIQSNELRFHLVVVYRQDSEEVMIETTRCTFYYIPEQDMTPKLLNLLSNVVKSLSIKTNKQLSPKTEEKVTNASLDKLLQMINGEGEDETDSDQEDNKDNIFNKCHSHGLGERFVLEDGQHLKIVDVWSIFDSS
jgi:hypothetical protein